jgi:Tfp pilus assembly protein PilN
MSTTQTAVRTSTQLPRVNLLPPEISEGAKFRTAQIVMGLALVASFVVVGALWYLASGDESAAQDQLASGQSTAVSLQGQVAKYAQVPVVYAQRATAKAQLDQALSQEIRYSYVMNDLSLTMPAGVWLTTASFTQPVDAPGSIKGAWGNPADGTVTLGGQAGSLPQVAGWLQALANQRSYTDPYLSSTQSSGTGASSTAGYTFSSTVSLSAKALSNRYARVDN